MTDFANLMSDVAKALLGEPTKEKQKAVSAVQRQQKLTALNNLPTGAFTELFSVDFTRFGV